MACRHANICFEPSSHAEHVGYIQQSLDRRTAATAPSGRVQIESEHKPTSTSLSGLVSEYPSAFPGPLVLPNDELAYDPNYSAQSLRSWAQIPGRDVTKERRVIYVVPPPYIGKNVDFLNKGIRPQHATKNATGRANTNGKAKSGSRLEEAVEPPHLGDVVEYLQAFYYGVPVKILESPKLRYGLWRSESKSRKQPKNPEISIETAQEAIKIRKRTLPRGSLYAMQLNLNDLLDVAISILPSDAYALLMVVPHDLYEDEEDDFCCGRAYGGSRVAVVSSARYNPMLDLAQDVETEHAWPASHCADYMEGMVGTTDTLEPPTKKRATKRKRAIFNTSGTPVLSAIHAALQASSQQPIPTSAKALQTLWLGRVCKTASHELGHCVGSDHCVYYACIMQGTAGLSEDARQPPYLCPVDLAKVLRAIVGMAKAKESTSLLLTKAAREHYQALLAFCRKWPNDRLFCAFGAWLDWRIKELEVVG